jgi:hypothetical protein
MGLPGANLKVEIMLAIASRRRGRLREYPQRLRWTEVSAE